MTEHKEARPPLYPRFIWALLSGAKIELAEAPPSGKLRSWSQEGLASVTEIAATQLAAQRAQLDRLLGRAQLLFTTLLGLFALLVALAPGIWSSQTPLWEGWIPRSLLLLSAALLLIALLGAAALIAVRKDFDAISAIVLSNWEAFDIERLAREYAASVGTGQMTNDAHLTVFGTAVRFTLYGALALGFSWAVGFIPPAS
jgi:hypothetical protein